MDFMKVYDAFRNCVEKPKCRNCPWEKCEDLDYSANKVEIPEGLALDVLEVMKHFMNSYDDGTTVIQNGKNNHHIVNTGTVNIHL